MIPGDFFTKKSDSQTQKTNLWLSKGKREGEGKIYTTIHKINNKDLIVYHKETILNIL